MVHHDDIDLFVAVAELSSLTAAAKARAISPAVASAALKRLEKSLHTQLFARSTRSMRLTPQGQSFLGYARQMQAAWQAGLGALQQQQSAIEGRLTISVPSDCGRSWLMHDILDFRRQYPALHIHLMASDRFSDLYKSSVDIAIRYGSPPDSGLIMRPLDAGNRRVLCASPAYIQECGLPQDAAALAQHRCVCYVLKDVVYDKWRLGEGAAQCVVTVNPHLVTNDGALVRQWALMGEGVVYKSRLDVAEDLACGQLQLLLPTLATEPAPLYFAMAQKISQLPAANALYSYLQARIRQRFYPD